MPMQKNLETFQRFAPKAKQVRELTANAVIYTRVSSQEQNDNTSLKYQKKRCEEHAQRKGYRIVEYFGGTYESAKSDERKEFGRMINFAKNNKEKISRIIVLSYDRFSRTGPNAIYLSSNLKKLNIFIDSVTQELDTSTPMGEFMESMQFLFSKMDNDQRRQKSIAGMQEMMRAGYMPFRPPVGYSIVKNADWDDRIVLHEKYAPLIKKAFIMKAQQGKSNTEIAKFLSSVGLKVSRKHLSHIFHNVFYCAILTSSLLPGEVIQGKHPKLISEELFLQANNFNLKLRYGQKHQMECIAFPLKQFVKCDKCGTPLTAYGIKGKKAEYYKCNKIGCSLSRNTKILHDRFIELLNRYTPEPRSVKPIETMMGRVFNQLNVMDEDSAGLLRKQLAVVEANIDKLTDKFVDEAISKEIYDKTMLRYADEKKKIEGKIPKQEIKLSNLDEYIAYSLQISKSLSQIWEKADWETRQRVQNLVFPGGLRFSKEKNNYLTLRVNSFFSAIASISGNLGQKKSETINFKVYKSALVPEPESNRQVREDTGV